MPKTSNNTKPKKNATEEKLRATPFDDVSELDQEENKIRVLIWKKLTEAKVIEELMSKPEFSFILNELKNGFNCRLVDIQITEQSNDIYKISSDGNGILLEINKNFIALMGDEQFKFYQGVVQAGVEGYGSLYYQLKGLLSRTKLSIDSENT